MKLFRRSVPIAPTRSPFQDYMAAQRRMAMLERVGKFAVALVFFLAALGYFGR